MSVMQDGRPRVTAWLGRTLARGPAAVSSKARLAAVRRLVRAPGRLRLSGHVLCMCDPGDVVAATRITGRIPGEVRVIGMGLGGGPPNDAFVAAVTEGPFDAVIDLTGLPEEARAHVFDNAFYALRDGGVYVHITTPERVPAKPAPGRTVHQVVDDARALRERGEWAMLRAPVVPGELARAVADATDGPGCLVVTKAGQHLPKLRDAPTNDLLAARGSSMRVLDSIDPVRHTSGTTVSHHLSTEPKREFDPAYDVPRLWLREYRDALVLPGQVAIADGIVLPDSFRHNLEPRLHNKHVVDSNNMYARLRHRVDAERLDGTYFYLDDEYPSAYGHLLTEQVSRLWGWHDALREHPDLRILLSAGRHGAGMERTVLDAFGIPPERVTVLTRPARVERLVAASPMFQNPYYASPQLLDIWTRLWEGFRTRRAPGAGEPSKRFFVSRPMTGARICWNTPEVEDFFADRGFAILLPAELPMHDQVAHFASAEVVAGFGGSALVNGIYGVHPSTRIIIGHEAYNARNEHLISCLFDDDQHYFWARPDVDHPRGGWSVPAFVSSFTFDLKRAAPYMDEVIAARDHASA